MFCHKQSRSTEEDIKEMLEYLLRSHVKSDIAAALTREDLEEFLPAK